MRRIAQLRDRFDELRTRGLDVLVVLCQKRDTVAAWLLEHPLPFPILLDGDRSRAKRWGVYVALWYDAIHLARPAAFIVDAAGVIRYARISSNQMDHAPFEELLAAADPDDPARPRSWQRASTRSTMIDSASVAYMVRLTRNAAWAPLGVLLLHAVGGRLLGHEPYVDPTMHFLGGVAAAYFIRYASTAADKWLGSPSEAALDLLAFGLTCAVALAWEFGEFAASQYFGQNVQRGLGNTMRDLALGVGGSIVFLWARRQIRPHREPRDVVGPW